MQHKPPTGGEDTLSEGGSSGGVTGAGCSRDARRCHEPTLRRKEHPRPTVHRPGASVPLLRRQLVDAGADGLLEVDEVLEPPGLAELSEDPPLLDEPLLSELELDDDEESLFDAAAAPESVLDEPDLLSVR